MAPTRPQKSKANGRKQANGTRTTPQSKRPDARTLYRDAVTKFEQGEPAAAAKLANEAAESWDERGVTQAAAAYTLLGEIQVELGEMDAAREAFLRATEIDKDGDLPEDIGGGADKYLWLAQLSETGGAESVRWFQKGAAALRGQIQKVLEQSNGVERDADVPILAEKRAKLADALCAVAEVYMTDLSWESDAEAKCEAMVTEASILAPETPGTWATLANVRISQGRVEDAREALRRNLELWMPSLEEDDDDEEEDDEEDEEDDLVPEFAARVSLLRLLIEVEMEEEAIAVAERLVREDDESVEAWYLGGYAHFRKGERLKTSKGTNQDDPEEWKVQWRSARTWLAQCLLFFQKQGYEDERLGEHTKELLEAVIVEVGNKGANEEEEWEDEVDDEEEDGEDHDSKMS
jgi:tetratricopeptide (TPR) repeat protein